MNESNNGKRSWAEEIDRRQGDLFEIQVRDGMAPLKFRRAEMLDCIEEGYLPEDLLQIIMKKFFGKDKQISEAEAEEFALERSKDFLDMMKRIAIHQSYEPKLTLSANGDEADGALPWRWFSQRERMRIIEGIQKMLTEGLDGLRPFRGKADNETDSPDGANVQPDTGADPGDQGHTDGMATEQRDLPEA